MSATMRFFALIGVGTTVLLSAKAIHGAMNKRHLWLEYRVKLEPVIKLLRAKLEERNRILETLVADCQALRQDALHLCEQGLGDGNVFDIALLGSRRNILQRHRALRHEVDQHDKAFRDVCVIADRLFSGLCDKGALARCRRACRSRTVSEEHLFSSRLISGIDQLNSRLMADKYQLDAMREALVAEVQLTERIDFIWGVLS